MVVVLDFPLQGQGRQRVVPGVRRAVAEVVDCVVLADPGDAVEWTRVQYDGYRGISKRGNSHADTSNLPCRTTLLSLKP